MQDDNQNLSKWKILQQKVFENRICKSFALFRENGIEPILIKGWAAARNYPVPTERLYTDIDLAVSEKDFENAVELAAHSNLFVDLHKELRHLDTLDWKTLKENSRLITPKIYHCPIRILSAEDHLRVLCVHWLNDGGAHREKLWDVYYAVANRPADFDWQKCLDVVGRKRRTWIICAVKLAERYLGLDIDDTPIARSGYELPVWVRKTVENEWNSAVKLRPLRFSPLDFKELYEQFKIRIPPNPIQATIEMDREFDERTRRFIQLENIIWRIGNRLKRK